MTRRAAQRAHLLLLRDALIYYETHLPQFELDNALIFLQGFSRYVQFAKRRSSLLRFNFEISLIFFNVTHFYYILLFYLRFKFNLFFFHQI